MPFVLFLFFTFGVLLRTLEFEGVISFLHPSYYKDQHNKQSLEKSINSPKEIILYKYLKNFCCRFTSYRIPTQTNNKKIIYKTEFHQNCVKENKSRSNRSGFYTIKKYRRNKIYVESLRR